MLPVGQGSRFQLDVVAPPSTASETCPLPTALVVVTWIRVDPRTGDQGAGEAIPIVGYAGPTSMPIGCDTCVAAEPDQSVASTVSVWLPGVVVPVSHGITYW